MNSLNLQNVGKNTYLIGLCKDEVSNGTVKIQIFIEHLHGVPTHSLCE